MQNKVLFMIIGNEVKYLHDSNMDHREWYLSLGLDSAQFDSIVRGFVLDGKIVFYKGATFQYDEEVIRSAKAFAPNIRYTLANPNLEVYCGLIISQYDSKWEPVLRIQENEITGVVPKVTKEEISTEPIETGPVLELKNDYQDEVILKRAWMVTTGVLIVTFLIKILLFRKGQILNIHQFTDVLLVLAQVAVLGFTIYGFFKKKSYAKYLGFVASFLLVMTLDFADIVIGVLYFLFCIDQNYFLKIGKRIKDVFSGSKNEKSS